MAKIFKNNVNKTKLNMISPKAIPKVKIQYFLNDPSTPSLVEQIDTNFVNTSLFRISNYIGPNTDYNTNAGVASNCCGVLSYDMSSVYNKYADLKISKWSTVNTLNVNPVAGNMANAFYDRRSLQFFYFNSGGKRIYTALSQDVVSHELGHAILDFLRPEFWSTASLEIFAFHEAFGDVWAFLCSVHHDIIIDFMLKETNGNLFESNVASKIGEQFGISLGIGGYLRNVDNDLSYVKPSNLPANNSNPEVLTKEPHNFSRIISGVIYRIFAEIYTAKGKNKSALITARDFVRTIFLRAAKNTPASADFTVGFARIMYQIAKSLNADLAQYVFQVCNARNLLISSPMMSLASIENSDRILLCEEDHCDYDVKCYNHVVMLDDIIETNKHKCLSGVKVKLACDDINFKNESLGFGQQKSDLLSSVECATDAVNFILNKNQIGDVWQVNSDGMLERIYIKCDGFVNNCKVEGQPEYNKCWKYGVSGCGCGGPYGCPPEPKKVEKKIPNFCGGNYSIKCAGTRINACQAR